MTRMRRAGPLAAGALIVGLVLGVVGVLGRAQAADHLDAPGLTSPGGNGQLDIADIYAFRSPDNAGYTTLVMTVNPAAGVFSPTSFSRDANYQFVVDNDRDSKPDGFLKVNFRTNPDADGNQRYWVAWAPAGGATTIIAEGSTGDTLPVDGGGRAWAGLADDPFFFDLNAFLGAGGRTFCDGGESDFFAGLNVNAIVLEVRTGTYSDDAFAVWGRTKLGTEQVDRVGFPAVNTVFIPSGRKTQYNQTVPWNDSRLFSDFVGDLSGLLLPDQMPLDATSAAGFPNGRQPADDVIDTELQLITGDPVASDCVGQNDVPFPGAFPYVAPAHESGS